MKTFAKRTFIEIAVAFISIGLFIACDVSAYASNGDTIVYVTDTGSRYHRLSCGYLWNSCKEVKLKDAVKKYTACSRCRPESYIESTDDSQDNMTSVHAQSMLDDSAEFMTHEEIDVVEALKSYKGNTEEFNAYNYYMNYVDLQNAIGADGDKLLKHYNEYGKVEGRVAK